MTGYIVLSSKGGLDYSSALKNVDVKDANKMFQSHFIHCKFLSKSIDSGKLMQRVIYNPRFVHFFTYKKIDRIDIDIYLSILNIDSLGADAFLVAA